MCMHVRGEQIVAAVTLSERRLCSFSLAAGLAVLTGVGAAWRLRGRTRQAEAKANSLRRELLAERHAACHDALTGLPNRRAFFQIGTALVADPAHPPLVCVVFDLDGFKAVNDVLGHAVGDRVLITVARRFSVHAAGNLVARLGGDEFAGLLAVCTRDRGQLRPIAERLAETLAAPMQAAGRTLIVTASIGLAPVYRPSKLSEALDCADRAMYRAKNSRRPPAGFPRLVLMMSP
jgi:diguanylate cyclase (GGDEF)-like protein